MLGLLTDLPQCNWQAGVRMSLKLNVEESQSSGITVWVRRDTRVCRFGLPSHISGHGETVAFSARKEVTDNQIFDLEGSGLSDC